MICDKVPSIWLCLRRLFDRFLIIALSSESEEYGSPPNALGGCLSKSSLPPLSSTEHWLLPGENENIWQAKVTRGLCLYKASMAGPSEHCKVIKHFVITCYINSQQSSGITFPPSTLPLCVACVTWFSPGIVSNPNGVWGYWGSLMWKYAGPFLNLPRKESAIHLIGS